MKPVDEPRQTIASRSSPPVVVAALLLLPLVAAVAAPPRGLKPPAIDPHRIVNESFGFLRDREPQMTEEEYQLYERMVPMAATKPELAITLLESMLADDQPESPAFEYALGNLCFSNARVDLAETHFRNAIERFPDFLRAWLNLGVLYYSTDRFDQAVKCLSKAIALGDRDAQTLGLLAYSLYRSGDPLSAETLFMQAIAVQPDNKDWIGSVLQLLISNEEYARAEPLARKMVRLAPGSLDNWKLYATVLLSCERPAEAAGVLEVAVARGLADAETLRWLGDIYVRLELSQPALAAYRRLATLAPREESKPMLGVIQSMIGAGQLEQAAAALASAPPPEDDQMQVILLLTQAQLASARGQWVPAREALLALLKIAPLHSEALLILARTYREENDTARAELILSEAERVPEAAYRARVELARLALESGQLPRGIAYIESALALEKTPELEDHLRRLRRLPIQSDK